MFISETDPSTLVQLLTELQDLPYWHWLFLIITKEYMHYMRHELTAMKTTPLQAATYSLHSLISYSRQYFFNLHFI